MSDKRFQKTRIVDKWGGIYDSKTDKVLSVNDVEHKLNEQQSTINELKSKLKEKEEDDEELRKENERLKRENEALESNVKWFAHQLKEHYNLYSDDFLETLETIEGDEIVKNIRERQNKVIKNLRKEGLL